MASLRGLATWAVAGVALLMVALMLVPVEFWHEAEHGPVYRGFDANLVYIRAQGPQAPSAGLVQVSPESLLLTALPASEPAAHLLTTPLSFRANMKARILERGEAGTPLRMGIWSVRNNSGYYLNFGPPPQNLVTGQLMERGRVKTERTLGTYSVGQTYDLELALDREVRTIRSHLSSSETFPVAGNAIKLDGGPEDPTYADVSSSRVPVDGGRTFTFGAWVRLLSGSDTYKVSTQWYDERGEYLGVSNDWRGVDNLDGFDWTQVRLEAEAPPEAAWARVLLGSGNGTGLLFTGVFLGESGAPEANLLASGNFQDGLGGWELPRGSRRPEVISPALQDVTSVVTAEDASSLFDGSRLTLTASASSPGGIASSTIEDYTVTLPARMDLAVQIDDDVARSLVFGLLAAGGLLCLCRAALWGFSISRRWRTSGREQVSQWVSQSLIIRFWPVLFGLGALALLYLVMNGLLFHLGRHPFDMTSQKTWAYIAAHGSMLDLYPQASLVSLAAAWNGAPYHEAVFPYPPVMAYYFTVIGWLDKLFLTEPGQLSLNTFPLEFVIKAGNVLFGFADSVLIYLILRHLRLERAVALLAAGLFLFNPALWVDMSLWGETETISLFLVLLSIWFAEREQPLGAWFAVGMAALTRPQMAVPAVILALVYLRKFPVRRNVPAISWSVIVLFLLMGPFLLHFSPSLPLDYIRRVHFTQLAGGGEAALQTVGNSGYSIWPLVTFFMEGESGLARFSYPEAASVVGSLSYGQASNLLLVTVLFAVAGVFILRPQSVRSAADYIPLLAVAMLGWSMVMTGMISRYFLYSLAFIILSRRSINGFAYACAIGILTLTTLVSTYGGLGFALSQVPSLAPDLHHGQNAVTRFFMDLYSADWFITLGVLANLGTLAWLAAKAVLPLWTSPMPGREAPLGRRITAYGAQDSITSGE